MKKGYLMIISFVLGILCLLYFFGVAIYSGLAVKFTYVWLALASVFLILAILLKCKISFWEWCPKWIRLIVIIGLMSGAVFFVVVEGMIISGFVGRVPDKLDYVVVLGAHLKESGPSKTLRKRLDAAYDYVIENPGTKIIVSGGQGLGEPTSEAEGMQKYLLERGILGKQIQMEDLSRNTFENLTFSKAFIIEQESKVGIVSSDFHLYRAKKIASKAGYTEVYGIPSRSDLFLQPNNMLREFFAVTKDWLVGNL